MCRKIYIFLLIILYCVRDMKEDIDIMPRYNLLIRLTKRQKEFLEKLKKENKIPAAYYIRMLIDKKIDEMEHGKGGVDGRGMD